MASASSGTTPAARPAPTTCVPWSSTPARSSATARPSVVAVTGGAKGRPVVVIATNQAARDKGIKAGELVRIAAQTLGGGGGGKDDIAQGGGQDLAKSGDAINAVEWRVGELVG